MVFQGNLLEFFENLPHLPREMISKFMGNRELVTAITLSPIWSFSVASQPLQHTRIDLFSKKDQSEIVITFDNNSELKIQFTGVRSDKRFLITDKMIIINGGIELPEILETHQRLIRKFSLYSQRFEIDRVIESKIQKSDLLNLNSGYADFGANQFTDKDFNEILHSWVAGKLDKVMYWRFKVDKALEIDQVIRGLITEKWDKEKRDRKFIYPNPSSIYQPPIDMADGHDITRLSVNGVFIRATILITQQHLHFAVWDEPFRFSYLRNNLTYKVITINRYVEAEKLMSDKRLDHLEKDVKDNLESLRNILENPNLSIETLEYQESMRHNRYPYDSDSDWE